LSGSSPYHALSRLVFCEILVSERFYWRASQASVGVVASVGGGFLQDFVYL
jgi:hypothetical protein